jgi:ABC-type multidrug transport system ATPase subunit
MTGVRRDAYYFGSLFIPYGMGIFYAILVSILNLDLWNIESATGPMFLFLICSSLGYVSFFWLISQLVTDYRLATLFVTLFTASGAVTQALSYKIVADLPGWSIVLICLNPANAYHLYVFVSKFSSDAGFTSISFPFTAPSVNTLAICAVSFTLLHIFLAIYVDSLQISKDEWVPWHYPISRFFQKPVPVVEEVLAKPPRIEPFESSQYQEKDRITVKNLTKIYHGAAQKALSNVSLDFYRGEIFGLIGFNGAGKSTLINILVGVLSATSGLVQVFGLNSKESRAKIAAVTGICSQDDILYDDLTAKEHLLYFGLMRNVNSKEIQSIITQLSDGLRMEKMLSTFVKNLSGGQKRKLSIALAFIHNPDLVVLDEMSSGVDPENRRIIWDFLHKWKENRAILLCTHFMDEADIVCKRKALLTKGQVVCVGSSSYLKHVYNTGYSITVEKSKSFDQNSFQSRFLAHGISATLVSNTSTVQEYQIPTADISKLSYIESDSIIQSQIRNLILKENGLHKIFSSNELVNEQELNSSNSERETIRNGLESFKPTTFMAITRHFASFEFKRTRSTIISLLTRMVISIILVVVFWIFMRITTTEQVSSESVPLDSAFVDKLFPAQYALVTNSTALLEADSRFKQQSTLGSLISAGTVKVGETNEIMVAGGLIGPVFLAASLLQPSNSQTMFEYLVSATASGVSGTTILVGIITIVQLYLELLNILTEDIAEAKESIKYLLLASGVPLSSYWLVMLLKNFIIVLPFLIMTAAMVVPDFPMNSITIAVYFLQIPILSAIIGTYFSKSGANTAMQILRILPVVSFTMVLIIAAVAKIPESAYDIISIVYYAIGPWSPVGLLADSFFSKGEYLVSPNQMLLINFGYFFLFMVMLTFVEIGYKIRGKVQTPVSEALIIFRNVVKRFVSWRKRKVVVDKLNLEIYKNELFALLGTYILTKVQMAVEKPLL